MNDENNLWQPASFVADGSTDAAVIVALNEQPKRARQAMNRSDAEESGRSSIQIELHPLSTLSHLLLQNSHDLAAAERALHEILALDPSNTEANHNLAVLAQKTGRTASA